MSVRVRLRLSGTALGILLAATAPAPGQAIKGEEIVKYLQPGQWEIEIIPDTSRMTDAQKKRLEQRGPMRSTDCLDAHGKSQMMEGLDLSEAQKKAESECKTKLTPLGAHEAKIVTTCNAGGRVTEITMTCKYTTLEVARKDPEGHEHVYKKARRTGECK